MAPAQPPAGPAGTAGPSGAASLPRLDGTAWLVVGGAGYIGAHVVQALLGHGARCVVLDDLSTGRRARVPDGVPLVVADAAEAPTVAATAREHAIEGVVHLAALKQARESVREPLRYWRVNLGAVLGTLEGLQGSRARWFVFSSSCSVYGHAGEVTPATALAPISPYGHTKAVGEQVLADCCPAQGLSHAALRYFNVVGNGAFPEAADMAGEGLVPCLSRRVLAGQPVQVNGRDFPTRDGSAVRDYVDVRDLAEAHALAGRALRAGHALPPLDISTGTPSSVLEVVATLGQVTGRTLAVEHRPRLAGDPAEVWAHSAQARDLLGWVPRHTLADSLRSHWQAVTAAGR